MADSPIRFTPTVRAVLEKLGDAQVSAAAIVHEILNRHQEYAAGGAREVTASLPEQEAGETRPAEQWLFEVAALFDPSRVRELHGRLAILGLCRLDEGLGRHLRGFTRELEKEVLEDFDALLLPEAAGAERYRGEFLDILQNRAKYADTGKSAKRDQGFLVLTHGGLSLDVMNGLCFKQRYNACLTARYQVQGANGLQDLLRLLFSDLASLAGGDSGTVGTFLPEPGGTQRPGTGHLTWRALLKRLPPPAPLPEEDAVDVSEKLGALLGRIDPVLETGQRLVLFLEWGGVADDLAPNDVGVADDLVGQLQSLPERVGVVISGLPASIAEGFSGPGVYHLELPEEAPRKYGQRLENDVPTGDDQLDIEQEVAALADAILLKDLQPPLVVGVFGGWGAGKSFVLHLIEQRALAHRSEAIGAGSDALEAYPFVGHPYLIRFDAWTYAKDDLWASLMQTTLLELDRQLSLERELAKLPGFDWHGASEVWRLLWTMSDKDREVFAKTPLGKKALAAANCFDQQGSPGILWAELEKLTAKEKKQLAAEEKNLQKLQQEQAREMRALERGVDDELQTEARSLALKPVLDELANLVRASVSDEDAKSYDQVRRAVPLLKKLRLGIRNLSPGALLFMAVSLVGGVVVGQLAAQLELLSPAIGALAAAATPVLRAWEWFEARRGAYEQRLAAAQEARDKSREQRIQEQIAAGSADGSRVAELGAQIEEQQATVERIRSRVGITGRGRNLSDFLKSRIESGLYQQKLGLLDDIQQDIQELSDTLLPARAGGFVKRQSTQALFPRGDPRVILLIDDLDRCPPERVVEVFEAAQLLVKTRLFVVVLAIDVRYVTRALEARYRDVLVRSGEPSGLDYIEKIIQIPYRVRAVSAPGIRRFLRSQMDVEEEEGLEAPAEAVEAEPGDAGADVEAKESAERQTQKARLARSARGTQARALELPTEALAFEAEDYVAISKSCGAIPVSPRTMKRLVNVFKLLKIIWYRQDPEPDGGPDTEVKQAMLSLLALCSHYPEVLRKLLADMEAVYRDEQSKLAEPLADYLEKRARAGAAGALYPPDWEQVQDAIRNETFFPQTLTFSGLGEANLHLLSSFSFVGETDAEREATLRRGFYRNSDTGGANREPAAAGGEGVGETPVGGTAADEEVVGC